MTYDEFKQQFHIGLNEQQEKAVQTVNGPVLLLAVPGSGKTTVLINRLGYMIYGLGIAPENVLTVTYTVAATQDMKARFARQFGAEYANRLEFRTINGLSQKILQYFGNLTGKRVFDVIDQEASLIIKKVFLEVNGDYATESDIKDIQTSITYAKNMRLKAEEIAAMDKDVRHFHTIYEKYNQELRTRKCIDYDDQMVYALRILEQYQEVRCFFQGKYKYLCVDEAQDTSKIQHDMIRLLAAESRNLFMVGDEDQSIYGFRAAYPQALIAFEKAYPDAKVLLMETNYRSGQMIVREADKLIQTNKKRHPKHMVAASMEAGSVERIPVKSRSEQYQKLMKALIALPQNGDTTAVLYRNNESALPLVDLMERRGIPYSMKSRDLTYFTHPVVRDICDFLRLAIQPWDGDAFLRIYYKMGAGISKAMANYAIDYTVGNDSLLDTLAKSDGIPYYKKQQCQTLAAQFRKMRKENVGKAITRVLYTMNYSDYIEEKNMDTGKAEILRALGEQEDDIGAFLERLMELEQLVRDGVFLDRGRTPSDSGIGTLTLSTIHSSKGLEYDNVYLIDAMDMLEPGQMSQLGKNIDIEEERRLMYVAMTRAKHALTVFV